MSSNDANWADTEIAHEWLHTDHDTDTDAEPEPPTQPAPWTPQPVGTEYAEHRARMDAAADAWFEARRAARGAA